jgi:hypothetical protein
MVIRRKVVCILSQIGLSISLIVSASGQWSQEGNKFVGTDAIGSAGQGGAVRLSADGNTAIVGGHKDNSQAGAAWIFTRSAGVWTQQGSKLVGTGASGSAHQGLSVGISADGNTVVLGGYNDNSGTGAVWVFTRTGGVWTQQGSKLVGTGGSAVAYQGCAVALSGDGNTLLVGGYEDNSGTGAAWVFVRSAGVWSQQGSKLLGINSLYARQGVSVALSGDGNTAAVGGHSDSNWVGAVWIFTRTGISWGQQGDKIVGSDATGQASMGSAVALSTDGNTLAFGGNQESTNGAIWIFTRSTGIWTQQGSKLVASGAAGPSPLGIGTCVSLQGDGNRLITGGFGDNYYRGAAWVFNRSNGVWSQQGGKLVGSGGVGSSWNQGSSVAISGDGFTALVGGSQDNAGLGATWVFTTTTTEVTEKELPLRPMLKQNFPNPFNPATTITFALSASSDVRLAILDMVGREVSVLVNERKGAGEYEVIFNGAHVASGLYLCRLQAGDFVQMRKLLLLR